MHVLLDGACTGAENMRRDDLLLAHAQPVLRLYGWSPETVSLGNSQTERDVDLDAVRALGLDVVKRGTGGGGILHNAGEVTYAIVVPIDHPGLPRDLSRSFAYLGQGVITALRALGVPAELESVADLTREALCYVRKQGTNVVVGGRKISGGAQRRTRTAVLQHGTIILDRDEHRLARVFRTSIETICARVTSLRAEGLDPTRAAILDALVAGFADAFGPLAPLDWREVPALQPSVTGVDHEP
jgi:lipoate-protein ligase A